MQVFRVVRAMDTFQPLNCFRGSMSRRRTQHVTTNSLRKSAQTILYILTKYFLRVILFFFRVAEFCLGFIRATDSRQRSLHARTQSGQRPLTSAHA